MEPIVIVTLIVAIPSFFGVVQNIRQSRWEHRQAEQQGQFQEQQQRLMLQINQPDLKPTGGSYSIDSKSHRLDFGANQVFDIHNEGGSTPSDVQMVFFPSATYLKPYTDPLERVPGLYGTYWYGQLDVSPAADGRIHIPLEEQRVPLRGEMSVIDGLTLSAPDEPGPISPDAVSARFYTGRLTMTFRDRTGRLLASVFDMEGTDQQKLVPVRRVVEVEHGLRELIDQAALALKPPSFVRDVLPTLDQHSA